MAWTPISNAVIQYAKDAAGTSASGYYLKLYASGTSTPFSMASASDGSGLLAKCQINSLGYPINGSGDVFIPHVDQDYRIVLYPTSADADANTFANAVFDVDGVKQQAILTDLSSYVSFTDLASTSGSGLVGRFDSINGLLGAQPVNGSVYEIEGYHASSNVGGGAFIYDASMSQTLHNGGTIIAEDAVFPTNWSDAAQKTTWFTAPASGTGCFVRLRESKDYLSTTMFGVKASVGQDDGHSLEAFIAAAEALDAVGNIGITLDFGCLWYESSKALTITGLSNCRIVGNFRITSTHDGLYILKLDSCERLNQTGRINLYGKGGTTFANRTNMFGLVIKKCPHMNMDSVLAFYVIGDAIRLMDNTSQGIVGEFEPGYAGSGYAGATSAPNSTLTSQVQTGSANSTNQRSVLTPSAIPQQLKDYLDADPDGFPREKAAYLEINGNCYLIESYSGSTVTVWPWVGTGDVGGTIKWMFGAGVIASGIDTSVVRYGTVSPLVCGVGFANYSLYGASIGACLVQYNGIGIVTSAPISNISIGFDIARGYFEVGANTFDIIQSSQQASSFNLGQVSGLTVSKCQRLWPADSAGTRARTYLNSVSINHRFGFKYESVGAVQTSVTNPVFYLQSPNDTYLSGASPTVTLDADIGYLRVFGRSAGKLIWYSNTNGMTPSGTITFTPPSGGTINGGAVDATKQFNAATGPAEFLISCSTSDGLTWFIEPMAASTITKL